MKSLKNLISWVLKGNKESRSATPDLLFNDEIEEQVTRFSQVEGMTKGTLVSWISQFDQEDWRFTLKVLAEVRFFSSNNVDAYTQEMVQMVTRHYNKLKLKRVYFVAIGDQGSSSGIVSRCMKRIHGLSNKVISLLEFFNLPDEQIDAVVFFNDFSGSGTQIKEWWELNEALFASKCEHIALGVLVLNKQANPVLEDLTQALFTVVELENQDNVLSHQSTKFNKNEKKLLRKYCVKTGCGVEYQNGFRNSGLLVAFVFGCPNNSLPILWYINRGIWKSLFRRRELPTI